jgi:4-amino-4-deoxy-L-arabinose transferase-like glycosyltransferase
VLLSVTVVRQSPRFFLAGFIGVLAALLLIPSIWSGLTVQNSSENQSLPSAYSGRASGPANRGRVQVNQALLDYLQKNTQGITYLMAVPSSMQGADYVLASRRPVLYLGGFMGQDRVVSSEDLARLVAEGKLRYVYWNAMGGGFGNQSDISNWVTNRCKAVTGFETSTRNSGAPDGTLGGQPAAASYNQPFGGFMGGNMRVSLYDCKKY